MQKPAISSGAQEYVNSMLSALEREHGVKILFAIESGSRAWGFPSMDSDYDVRFVYKRPIADYLSVQSPHDVIETPLVHDEVLGVPIDLNGWDVRKGIQLALKSNATLVEWLVSPIRYLADEAETSELLAFGKEVADLQAFKFHYDRLARNAWEQIQEHPSEVKLKRYFYALRPVMCLQWINHYSETPPMDLPSLCAGLIQDAAFQREISELVEQKSVAKESDIVKRSSALDSFIALALSHKTEPPVKSRKDRQTSIHKADRLFQKIIGL